MNKLFITLFYFALFSIFAGGISCQHTSPVDDPGLQNLKAWMTGSFSSQKQAEADTNFFDIRLEMVPIWEEKTDAIWLYVEQAAAWKLEKPYRQRLYKLSKTEYGRFESAIYTINNPLQYAGAWKNKKLLNQLSPDSVFLKEGCAILFELKEESFVGTTDGEKCASNLYGSKYATSEVSIQKNVVKSLDRGYDSVGNQIWGSEYGPYIFKKIGAHQD